MTTLKQLRDRAKKVGCEIEVDDDCQCYRATAPDGYCWEPELHELIAVFGGGIIGNGATKSEARKDLMDRIKEYDGFRVCTIWDCDWCQPIHHQCEGV